MLPIAGAGVGHSSPIPTGMGAGIPMSIPMSVPNLQKSILPISKQYC